jgi:hypothetical protein
MRRAQILSVPTLDEPETHEDKLVDSLELHNIM